MSKIINEKLKGKWLVTSMGTIKFDENGVADIQNEELAANLLQLKGYQTPEGEDTPKSDFNNQKDDGEAYEEKSTPEDLDTQEDENKEEFTEAFLSSKNVVQLRKIATDNNIDLQDAKTKAEIISIILGTEK